MAVKKRGKVVGGDSRGGLGFYGNTEVQVPLCSGESSRAIEDSIDTGWGVSVQTCFAGSGLAPKY